MGGHDLLPHFAVFPGPYRGDRMTAGTSVPRILNGQYALGAAPRRGGAALVYRASDLNNDNAVVAVKVLQQGRHGRHGEMQPSEP